MTRRPAFTLVDAVFALVVLAMTVVLIQMSTRLLDQQTKLSLSSETDWYGAIAVLESRDYDFWLVAAQEGKLTLRDKQGRDFSLAANRRGAVTDLALKGSEGGYIPVLLKVYHDSLHFRALNDHEVSMQATTTDGRKHEAIVQFQPPPGERPTDGDRDPNQPGDGNGLQHQVPSQSAGDQPATVPATASPNTAESSSGPSGG